MRVVLAKHIGFCSGVKRAVSIVEKLLKNKKKNIFCFGAVIHNQQVLEKLKEQGLKEVSSLKEIRPSAYLVLPSHGTTQDTIKLAKQKKLKIIDVTCPYVASVQNICKELNKVGYQILILGDKDHPEIKALLSIAPKAKVVKKASEIKSLDLDTRLGVISQTTQSKENLLKLIEYLLSNKPIKELRMFNTICLDSLSRQREVVELAKHNDAVLVIGSKISANTKRLFNISLKFNPHSYLIDGISSLNPILKNNFKSIGVISGASTPDWLVEEIIEKIKNYRKGGMKND